MQLSLLSLLSLLLLSLSAIVTVQAAPAILDERYEYTKASHGVFERALAPRTSQPVCPNPTYSCPYIHGQYFTQSTMGNSGKFACLYKPSTHDDHSPPFTCAYHNASLQTSKQQPKECPHHSKKSCHKSHKKRSPEEAIIARNQWSNTKKLQAEEGTNKEFSFSKR